MNLLLFLTLFVSIENALSTTKILYAKLDIINRSSSDLQLEIMEMEGRLYNCRSGLRVPKKNSEYYYLDIDLPVNSELNMCIGLDDSYGYLDNEISGYLGDEISGEFRLSLKTFNIIIYSMFFNATSDEFDLQYQKRRKNPPITIQEEKGSEIQSMPYYRNAAIILEDS